MVMRCPAFESLIKDMKKNEIDKEHYSFVYNGQMCIRDRDNRDMKRKV